MKCRSAGFSLLEMLVVLAILVILLVSATPSGFTRGREARETDKAMTDLIKAIAMARQYAVAEAAMVTFCRSDDGLNCQGDWHEGGIIFTDANADRLINDGDRLLFRLPAIKADGRLTFNSFRNHQYLQMTAQGFTNYQNGNFTYCPLDKDPRMARQIIVSMNGRTRFAVDGDGDGIPENSQGQALACD